MLRENHSHTAKKQVGDEDRNVPPYSFNLHWNELMTSVLSFKRVAEAIKTHLKEFFLSKVVFELLTDKKNKILKTKSTNKKPLAKHLNQDRQSH